MQEPSRVRPGSPRSTPASRPTISAPREPSQARSTSPARAGSPPSASRLLASSSSATRVSAARRLCARRSSGLRDGPRQARFEAALVHSPDRLARRYAYQVLLSTSCARGRRARVRVRGRARGDARGRAAAPDAGDDRRVRAGPDCRAHAGAGVFTAPGRDRPRSLAARPTATATCVAQSMPTRTSRSMRPRRRSCARSSAATRTRRDAGSDRRLAE